MPGREVEADVDGRAVPVVDGRLTDEGRLELTALTERLQMNCLGLE